jgi:WD40 repeat protein
VNTWLHTLVVSAGTTTASFHISTDLTSGSLTVGLWVPGTLTGSVKVTAEGVGTACGPGFLGSTTVVIPSAGATVDASIIMDDTTTCPPNSGSGGTSGRGGSSGSTGTGGTNGGLNCTEVDHEAAGTCASCASGATTDVPIFGVAFSPTNPQLVVTGGGDGKAKVWTVGSNRMLTAEGHVLAGNAGYSLVAFTPNGATLAVGRSGSVDIVDVATWTVNYSLTITGTTFGVGFTPDGQQLLVASYSSAATTETLSAFAAGSTVPAHTTTILNGYALAVSPVSAGGATPVAVTTSDGKMEVFNLTSSGFSTPTTVTVTSDQSYAEIAVFAPSGNVLAAGGDDGYLNFWSVPVASGASSDGFPIDVFFGTVVSSEVWSAAYSPDGTNVAVGANGSLSIWDAAAPRTAALSEYDPSSGYAVVSTAYSPNGNLIVAGEGHCGCVLVCPK